MRTASAGSELLLCCRHCVCGAFLRSGRGLLDCIGLRGNSRYFPCLASVEQG